MDLSPKSLREVEFREKLRGYHPEDVDGFLEQVATGLEALQERLRQATERAVHAEQLAAESGVNDESIRRTLVLAQRTADMAIEEAREQAAAIVADAEERVRTILTEGQAEAEAVARRAQAELRSDLDRLSTARQKLREEVAALEGWVAEHRQSLSTSLTDALGRLEEGLVTAPPPETQALDIPASPVPVQPEAALDAGVAGVGAGVEPVGEPPAAGGEGALSHDDSGGSDDSGDESIDNDGAAGGHRDDGVAAPDGVVAPAAGKDDDATGEVPAVETAGAGAGPDEDDPFLAELRRAVTDDEPLGPRDENEPLPVPTGQDREFEDGDADRRFATRRRWRK